MRASEWGMDVVWRLKRGKEGEDVMVMRGIWSEVMGSDGKVWVDGFSSEEVGIDGVGLDEVGSEVVGCEDLNFSLGEIICVVGGVKEVVTVVESVRGDRGSDEASCLEPEVFIDSEIDNLPDSVEEEGVNLGNPNARNSEKGTKNVIARKSSQPTTASSFFFTVFYTLFYAALDIKVDSFVVVLTFLCWVSSSFIVNSISFELAWKNFVIGYFTDSSSVVNKDESTPIVILIPGLTSDSSAPYLKHLAYHTAKRGWKVVVSNHRGLGGVPITSDIFYNSGWTEDTRTVVNYVHKENPKAPLFIVGNSVGANILVKYLGEEGENTPVAGAVAVCSPWDLLITDRFITRAPVQKFYDKALTGGLQDYAKLHQPLFSRLGNWEGIMKALSIRDFDDHATRLFAKYETVDTYYRRCSSTPYVKSVSIPLLCISALDDPVCTKEAIPWDECRLNKNIVLATVKHGGHLAFFEGITASSLWWVRAANEFLDVLHSSHYMHQQKKISKPNAPLDSSIDQSPYINVTEDGLVAGLNNEPTTEIQKKNK
ncbi:uncharacterized protein LOC127131659 [Lathyrus oleraceus]|uniref:uncharacterized protein LOC127131659 n=1 Tax=Pisum sativum TaxID=3888 RepID=UPI0021D0C31B|nr:uncharacterized protein LOC127131659 [Pisum sativum]